jgi:hypothetical protein
MLSMTDRIIFFSSGLGGTDESVPDPFLLLAAAAHPARHARILHRIRDSDPFLR